MWRKFSLAVASTVKGHVGMAALSIMGKQGEEAGQKRTDHKKSREEGPQGNWLSVSGSCHCYSSRFLDSLEFHEFSIINHLSKGIGFWCQLKQPVPGNETWKSTVATSIQLSLNDCLASTVWQEKQEPQRLKRKKRDCIHRGYESVGKG